MLAVSYGSFVSCLQPTLQIWQLPNPRVGPGETHETTITTTPDMLAAGGGGRAA